MGFCSPCVFNLCFYSEDRKQVILKSRASSLLSSYLTLFHSYFSLQYKQAEEKGQNEDREKERDKSGSHKVTSTARGYQSVASFAGSSLRSDMRHQGQSFTWSNVSSTLYGRGILSKPNVCKSHSNINHLKNIQPAVNAS